MAESEEELKSLLMKVKEESTMSFSSITLWQTDGEAMETVTDFIFLGSKITAGGDCSHEIKTHLLIGRKAMTNLDQHIKKPRYYFSEKGLYSQSCGFSSSHVWMCYLDSKRRLNARELMLLNLEKTLESPLDSKEIKPVNPKGNQS